MLIPNENLLENEPDLSRCRTRNISHELSRCLSNNAACKYAFCDCCTSIYCMYPDQSNFQGAPFQCHRQEPASRV